MRSLFYGVVLGLLNLSAWGQESYDLKDFSRSQLRTLKNLSGVYQNSRGDSLKVVFNKSEDKKTFEYYGNFKSNNGSDADYIFELDSYDKIDKNQHEFSIIEDDCDSPGCVTYEVYFLFKKNFLGKYYVTITNSVTIDTEEASATWEENSNKSKEQIEEILDKDCKAIHGDNAYLVLYVDDYKNSVYCGYEETYFLKKAK